MGGVVQFIKSIIMLAFFLGLVGSLVESTGWIGSEAIKAHRKGGISLT